MKHILWAFLAVALLAACGRGSGDFDGLLDEAELLLESGDRDSALVVLGDIDVADLREDSLRMRYFYITALAHMRQNRSMVADSLLGRVHDFYRHGGRERAVKSGTALAWYRFWVGDPDGAMALLDSLCALEDVADSLLVIPLRVRTLLGAAEYSGESNIPFARRLMGAERDSLRRLEAQYLLIEAYEYAGKNDSALMLTDELIEYAAARHWGDRHFQFEMERAQILAEMGRYGESNEAVAQIERRVSGQGPFPFLWFIRAVNSLNLGNAARAKSELQLADSLSAVAMDAGDQAYFQGFIRPLRTLVDYELEGHVRLTSIASVNNRQRERFNRMEASQWESERGGLEQQSRALALKAESEHKTVIILVITLVAVVILACALWIIRHRRQRERDNEERAEALQKMVDELSAAAQPSSPEAPPALRRALLQQLGIIRMVAETPTEQNREMLRRISSIDGDTDGALVNWDNVFDLINNLYHGFYDRLNSRFGDLLTLREKQIIVLMAARFSTKEISVITGQTTATIYVRKSAIRKKLGVAEKEDIVAFLRGQLPL